MEQSEYARGFGLQWKRFRRTQLDSYTGLPLSRERAERCLGQEVWRDLAGRQVLECGCGAGRFTEVLLERGAYVTSVDLSDAVEANQANFPQDGRHRIAQADIRRLPFGPQRFDLVFCLGVVQHTPDPEESVSRLYEQVRAGGTLVFDHYTYDQHWFISLKPLFRAVLRRLPPEVSMRYTERLVELLLPLHRRAGGLSGKLLNRLSPVYNFYGIFPQLSPEHQREWALLDTHDALTDWYKRFRTRAQLERLLRGLGLADISVTVAGNGIEARGRRPSR